jgi:hypothetical protein
MFGLNITFGRGLPNHVERDRSGNFFYSFLDNIFGAETTKVKDTTAFTVNSIALLTIRKFIADYGSLAKFHEYKNNKLFKEDYFYELAEKPNPNQTWTELVWQYLFYASAENVYIYVQNQTIYLLKKENIELTQRQQDAFKQMYFSDKIKKSNQKGSFKYKNLNGEVSSLELEKLFIIDFMSGISGDWFNGTNLFNACKDVVISSNEAIESKRRNIFYSKKILVSQSQSETQRLSNGLIDPKETESITKNLLNNSKPIHTTKGDVSINQLVSNLKQLGLDESFNNDFAKLTRLFNIPSDLIDLVMKGGVFNEAKEKSLGLFIYYTITPMLQKFSDLMEVIFDEQDIRPSFKHCPFNAVFERENQEQIKLKLENLKIAQELGLNVDNQLKEIYESYN